MNLRRFISSLAFQAIAFVSLACGAFSNSTSNPFVFHFYQEEDAPTIFDYQRNENIRLWQKLTSSSIPATAIRTAVYDITLDQLQTTFRTGKSDNQFLSWIISNKATDIRDFLLLAKEVEELRENRVSPWYYPADKTEKYDSRTEAEKFASVIRRCKQHTSGRLADRYALQYVRALVALGRFDDCISFYNTQMARYPDTNLFKKMAKGYVAGCLRRMGDVDKSNRMFAEVGDYNSIIDNKKSYLQTLVRNNPESNVIKYKLNAWIGYGEKKDNLPFLAIANAALNSPKVVNRGDWLFLKAYIEEVYNRNRSKAISYLNQALRTNFSREKMRHDAEVMSLCLNAEQGNLHNDLRDYFKVFKTESDPLFFYVIPALLKKGRNSEAILLANYASRIQDKCIADLFSVQDTFYSLTNDSERVLKITDNSYANTGFQLMLSMPAREVINYKRYLATNSPLVRDCLASGMRHDDDYLNEIIGTLYLREGNYTEAEKFLALVSEDYQENLNIKKAGYLYDNPWVNCYLPQDKWEYPTSKGQAEPAQTDAPKIQSGFDNANSALLQSDHNAKLNFAREMSRLALAMNIGTADERGLARIRYAMARYNSFNDCWALTQYWEGDANQCNYRPWYWIPYGKYVELKELKYLKEITGPVPDEEWLSRQIKRALNEIQSPEARAEANFLAGNYKTIAKHYPGTRVARYLSTHCDSWSHWL